ncbi:MAG: hypothetical protein EXS31_07715 [Pedosphaera sp.]|nr:hypothetical protein [Pedosphaera sp.]
MTRLHYSDEGSYDLVINLTGCGHPETLNAGPFRVEIEPMPPWLSVTSGGPDNRVGGRMVYDRDRQVCVMFGGEAFGFPDRFATFRQRYYANDTWEWDGTLWRKKSSDVSPSPRSRATAAFHQAAGKLLLYGGDIPNSPFYADEVWEWDGTNWNHEPDLPLAGYDYAKMVYDESRHSCVLFGPFYDRTNGGVNRSSVMEWDGAGWSEDPAQSIQYDASYGIAIYPDTRNRGVFFDPWRRQVVIYSHNYSAGFVTFDGVRFRNRPATPNDFYFPAENALAFDTARRAIVTFGSTADFFSVPGTTREVRFLDDPVIVRHPVSQTASSGRQISFATLAG